MRLNITQIISAMVYVFPDVQISVDNDNRDSRYDPCGLVIEAVVPRGLKRYASRFVIERFMRGVSEDYIVASLTREITSRLLRDGY